MQLTNDAKVLFMQARQLFILTTAIVFLIGCQSIASLPSEQKPLYGLIGKIKTKPGQRDAFAAILLQGTQGMPGCLSYIVANDAKDPDALWITEVWDSQASHKASLSLPKVKQALVAGRPLVSGFGERFETIPLGASVRRSVVVNN